jgi:hypothetical protein
LPAYNEIRTALSRGFYVDNLHEITNLSLAVLQENPAHPVIFLTIAAIARWVADAWDEIALSTSVATRVEGQLKRPLENLLNVADGNSAEVCVALDSVATAFREAVRCGLDSDLT